MMTTMNKSRSLYPLIAFVCVIYILYVLVYNYMVDPGAEAFLSRKTGLEHELKPRIWLKVMYIHVAFACLAMVTGLMNFSARSYGKHRTFHRVNGYVYVFAVLLVVLTSGYMAPYATGGKIGSMGFNLLNLLWLAITTTAIVHIRGKRTIQHRRWMIRSYALCFTNMLIHLLTFLLHDLVGIAYVTSYTIGLYGAIALLLVAPEAIFRMGRS